MSAAADTTNVASSSGVGSNIERPAYACAVIAKVPTT